MYRMFWLLCTYLPWLYLFSKNGTTYCTPICSIKQIVVSCVKVRNVKAKMAARRDSVEASHPEEHRVWLWSIGSLLCSKANERSWVTPAIIPHSLFSVARFLFQLFENQCYSTRMIILRTDDSSASLLVTRVSYVKRCVSSSTHLIKI